MEEVQDSLLQYQDSPSRIVKPKKGRTPYSEPWQVVMITSYSEGKKTLHISSHLIPPHQTQGLGFRTYLFFTFPQGLATYPTEHTISYRIDIGILSLDVGVVESLMVTVLCCTVLCS